MLILLFSYFGFSDFREDHSYSVSVKSKFEGLPIFEQILFYLSDYSSNIQKRFLTEILSVNDKIDDEEYLMDEVSGLITPGSFTVLKSYLDTNYYLPRGEMYRSLARDIYYSSINDKSRKLPDIFIAFSKKAETIEENTGNQSENEKVNDSLNNDLNNALSLFNSIPQIQFQNIRKIRSDISFSVNEEGGSRKVQIFIFVDFHKTECSEMILNLIKTLNDQNRQKLLENCEFIIRPISHSGSQTFLRGYGVEMRPFKYSMEYGGLDSTSSPEHITEGKVKSDETTKMFDGIINDISSDYLNISETSIIGERLTSYLSMNDQQKLPELLRDMSNNWPIYLRKIVNCETNQVLSDEYRKVADIFESNRLTSTFSSLNGRNLPLSSYDSFTYLDFIREETTFHEVFNDAFGKVTNGRNIVFSEPYVQDANFLLDFRSKYTVWNTDFETDPKYESWSTNVHDFMKHSRKNLLNFVLYIDPTNPVYLTELYTSYALFLQGDMPLRVGVVPYFNLGNRLSRRISFAFAHISLKSESAAIEFLIHAFSLCGINKETMKLNELKEDHFIQAYAYCKSKTVEWNDLYTLYGKYSAEYRKIKESNEYFKYCGASLGTMTINGKEISLLSGVQNFILQIQQMLLTIRKLCLDNNINDLKDIDVVDLLSQEYIVVPSIDKTVVDNSIRGIGIYKQNYQQQMEFIRIMNSIEWKYDNSNDKAESYFILFNNTESEIFDEFMINEKHSSSTAYSFNPLELKKFLRISDDETALLVNGRLYRYMNLENTSQLHLIDLWSFHFTLSYLKKYELNDFNAMCYLSTILIDWRSFGITRNNANHLFSKFDGNLNDNPLIYTDNTGLVEWVIIVDPFSKDYQRVSEFIYYLNKERIISLKLVLVPPQTISQNVEKELGSFYRSSINKDIVTFNKLNDSTTYSTIMDTPETWLLEQLKTSVDVDNVRLESLQGNNDHFATYILSNLVVEGKCFTGNQLKMNSNDNIVTIGLFNSNNKKLYETMIMPTSSYFQFQASPGFYYADMSTPKSKARFELSQSTKDIHISTFSRRDAVLFASPKSSYDPNKVYEEDTKNSTINTINVFTIASGKLYERLVKIMFLSVRKNTKSKLNFYLIKSLLSPSFKASLHDMSKQYGFKYQFVDYKWPSWLRKQNEKQRQIWGNKILFLDVLFPLSVERVIYVDADQIVRTDLQELMNMDFGDAPYAFTPFCDSRVETEPFRFWKQGYWQQMLSKINKKYHISALFAVDLKKFRSMNAGDWIRLQYQQLSNDPNSLANLDQDLPNSLQERIPIYSLPQNWLWCETWCADEEMASAKTIDLCNNPLTKIPKIEIAKTRVEEWPTLDNEVQKTDVRYDEYEKILFKAVHH
ncbi:hypothetical protein TRFO_05293 [Tritrichomonas foetus]|uniref:Glucosyltransferase 24 catalytic domain-containing protein n=1 Tax=Tritrichomonas foetus TaxID=1144522 RepID=A0A1J4K7A4_9EUKA|nr:hypothetical protein TRFO_05293 [Tritrichomonas foetus]|eukprot:OHT07083.1 hypothetical protein TRFO_05293 [Tritrichomonas foetus]